MRNTRIRMSDERIYVVTAFVEGEHQPRSYHVTAESPADAHETVRADDAVEEVLEGRTEQFSGLFRLEVSGPPEAISSAMDHMDHLAGKVDAEVDIEDVTPKVWPAGDDLRDDDAVRVAVDEWDDIEMRVVGTDIGDEMRVLSASPGSMGAHDGTAVEVVAGNRVLVRAVAADEDVDVPAHPESVPDEGKWVDESKGHTEEAEAADE